MARKSQQAKKIRFVPRWQGEISGWAVRLIRKRFAFFAAEHEFEDLVQEAYIVYLRCRNRYGSYVDNPAWFMALFKVSLSNELWKMQKRSSSRSMLSLEALEEQERPLLAELFSDGGSGAESCYEAVLLKQRLAQLPERITQLIDEIILGTEAERRRALRAIAQEEQLAVR